jgi:hypothetical protein
MKIITLWKGNPQNGPPDENRDFHNIAKGRAPLHSFKNTYIKNLHFPYDKILIRKENVNYIKIRNISKEIRNLKKEVKNIRDPRAKIEVNNRRKKIQSVRHVTGNDKDYLRKIPRVVW